MFFNLDVANKNNESPKLGYIKNKRKRYKKTQTKISNDST